MVSIVVLVMLFSQATVGRHVLQEDLGEQELISLISQGCNPTIQDCQMLANSSTTATATTTTSQECDDVAPSDQVTCEFYASGNICDELDNQYCQQSCDRCCQDIQVPGVTCQSILENQLCNSDQVLRGNFCEQTCGVCESQARPPPSPWNFTSTSPSPCSSCSYSCLPLGTPLKPNFKWEPTLHQLPPLKEFYLKIVQLKILLLTNLS
eukprot:TRINITY_DN2389_c0_g1_i1.p1 TRINITY_DN2389_c0_g1~~TRINITY_DN2389_c0_g1_i1.p1  ORF type:complete len:209 (+),score=17.12 TRINITY_DN2389_c0_g1_i1:169-795(+)